MRYMVVSYDDDQQQWFHDVVEGTDAHAAIIFVQALRPYVISSNAISEAELAVMITRMETAEPWDASEEVSECDNCGERYAQGQLVKVEHLALRVGFGEKMPSGECPSCGAVCHLVEEARK